MGESAAQPDGLDYPASRSSIRPIHKHGGRYAEHVLADSSTSRSKSRAGITGYCVPNSPGSAGCIRGIRRRRHAASGPLEHRCVPNSRRGHVRVGGSRQAGQLHRRILHPKGRDTWFSSGTVTVTRADRSSVFASQFRLPTIANASHGLRQPIWWILPCAPSTC